METEGLKMYGQIADWMNEILDREIPSSVKAFCFNLYEDEDNCWSMELVGAEEFDPDNGDWACEEITDFGTREEPLSWKGEAAWYEILEEIISALKQYLQDGLYASVLKSCEGVGVGFVDGDLEILYAK